MLWLIGKNPGRPGCPATMFSQCPKVPPQQSSQPFSDSLNGFHLVFMKTMHLFALVLYSGSDTTELLKYLGWLDLIGYDIGNSAAPVILLLLKLVNTLAEVLLMEWWNDHGYYGMMIYKAHCPIIILSHGPYISLYEHLKMMIWQCVKTLYPWWTSK